MSLSYLSNIINTLYQESQQVFTTLPTNLKKSIEDLQTTGSKLFNDIYTMGMNRITCSLFFSYGIGLKELFIQPSFEQFQKLFINTSYDISYPVSFFCYSLVKRNSMHSNLWIRLWLITQLPSRLFLLSISSFLCYYS